MGRTTRICQGMYLKSGHRFEKSLTIINRQTTCSHDADDETLYHLRSTLWASTRCIFAETDGYESRFIVQMFIWVRQD